MGIATVTMVLNESRQQRNLSSVSYHAVQYYVKTSSVRELQEAAVQERKATNVRAKFHPTLHECWSSSWASPYPLMMRSHDLQLPWKAGPCWTSFVCLVWGHTWRCGL